MRLMAKVKRILIIVNHSKTILNFRLELVEQLLKKGHKVLISSPYDENINELTQMGCEFYPVDLSRHGMNPIEEIKLIKSYKTILKLQKPDIVLTFTIKPNVYGAMACRSQKIPCVANITGLGTAIENGGLSQFITVILYKLAFKKIQKVFFQNEENMKFFKKRKIAIEKHELLPGSGVNVERFSYAEYPNDEVNNIVFVGRIMKDKGVFELAKVAKRYLENDKVKFTVVGDVEIGSENPFVNIPNVEYVGYHKDVRPILERAHAVILPSYHEGMANVLLEGAAVGRVVLATNIPGCRETFEEGITGFGFEPKNVESMKNAIDKFLSLSFEEKHSMGKAGREKMERQFNRQIVVSKYLDLIND